MKHNITLEDGIKRINGHDAFPLSPYELAKLLEINHMTIRRAARGLGFIAPQGKRVLYKQETAKKIWQEVHARTAITVVV